jgi:hypothetical protein
MADEKAEKKERLGTIQAQLRGASSPWRCTALTTT